MLVHFSDVAPFKNILKNMKCSGIETIQSYIALFIYFVLVHVYMRRKIFIY